MAVVVRTAVVPTYGQILTTSTGMPLYTVSGSCTGGCATAWPPLTVPAGRAPTGVSGVGETLSTVKRSDGTVQVTYNGAPLYTFAQDSSGHVTGQGVAGFSVVRLSHPITPKPTTTTGSTSGNTTGGY
jgi:predicted lipoprotein with Yx(FWY)xxD motif